MDTSSLFLGPSTEPSFEIFLIEIFTFLGDPSLRNFALQSALLLPTTHCSLFLTVYKQPPPHVPTFFSTIPTSDLLIRGDCLSPEDTEMTYSPPALFLLEMRRL